MLAFRTILHPTDFSDRSALAFELACGLARDHGARIVVLHVIEPPVPPIGLEGMVIPPPPVDRERLRRQLDELRPTASIVRVERRLTDGSPAEEILRVANEVGCDLIVLGTHGRTGLGRLLMGSVAEQVLRKAHCPVVTVKAPSASAAGQAVKTAVGAAR